MTTPFKTNILLPLFCVLLAGICQAQVAIGTQTAHTSAMLDITSVNKGFLAPRMHYDQILNIPSPAEGLIVYNLDFHKPCYFNGTRWNFFNDAPMELAIGTNYAGGIIVYLDDSKIHGIVAAAADQNSINSSPWGCNGVSVDGAAGTALGAGLANTNAIVAACATPGIAARLCADLSVNGYTDWYLPSRDEFAFVCAAKQYLNLAGALYYTSSQYSANSAYYSSTSPCGSYVNDRDKNFLMTVRAVRNF